MKNNKIDKVTGTSMVKLNTIAKKLNFQLQFVEGPYTIKEAPVKTVKNLETNKVNLTPMGLLLNENFQQRDVIIGYPVNLSKLVIVAPALKTPRIDIAANTLSQSC